MSSKKSDPSAIDVRGPAAEPLAIIGMSCRFPGGVESPDQYWEFLCEGRSGIVEIPASRWNVERYLTDNEQDLGRSVTKWAGFIDDPDHFDAEFFGISPREAAVMDPQQRVLLMCTWEALEDAGIPRSDIGGTQAGVYVGVSLNDYRTIQRSQMAGSEVHSATGSAISIVANRLSNRFDLRGPSASVDTACSSSLVATHLAAESLRRGETDLCVVAGINLIFDPSVFVNFSGANMMSPTGLCQSFDAKANGYVRAEGAGVVILKRLSEAQRDKDRIYALVRSTAVNQDGKTSTITVPSADAQAAMLRQALKSAQIEPGEVDFVEAHGTGTPVGDPIEANAIGRVFGQCERDDDGVYIGAGKSQIGHLESGAGIAGLMKAALTVRHGTIPPNLNFSEPNPNIDFGGLRLKMPLQATPWPNDGRSRIAAVNSFGFGGTNGCAIVQEPPEFEKADARPHFGRWVVPLSAATKEALRARARDLAALLEESGPRATPLCDVVGTLSFRREHLPERAAVFGKSRKDLLENFRRLADDGEEAALGAAPTFVRERVGAKRKLLFVFTGQGSQSWNMGRQLLERDEVFRTAVAEFDEAFADIAGWSVLDELTKEKQASRIDLTRITQPCILAVQLGLVARWRAWGVVPEAVLGHSLGEVAAAHVAGGLSLEDTALCIYHRARLSEITEGRGGIAAVGMSASDARDAIEELSEGAVEVAAVNGSGLVSLAGEKAALERVLSHLEDKGNIFVQRIAMNYAPHTAMMEEIKDELIASTVSLTQLPTEIPMISTVTGTEIAGQALGADYWWRNLRQPVLFKNAVAEAAEHGFDVFLEIGPRAALSSMVRGCLGEVDAAGTVIGSLHRKTRDQDALHAALGSLFAAGVEPDWSSLTTQDFNFVDLPRYPWQLTRYFEHTEATQEYLFAEIEHPLLGIRQTGVQPTWRSDISSRRIPFLADHILQNSPIFPASGYMEIMLAAGRSLFGDGVVELQDLSFFSVMQVPDEEFEQLETSYETSTRRVTIHSRRKDANEDWILRASAKLSVRDHAAPELYQWQKDEEFKKARDRLTKSKYYGFFGRGGLYYQEAFQGVGPVWCAETQTAAMIRLPEACGGDRDEYLLHPVIGDSGLQLTITVIVMWMMRVLGHGGDLRTAYLPMKMDRVRFFRKPGKRTYCRTVLVEAQADGFRLDLEYFDEKGRAVCVIEGLFSREVQLRGDEAGTSSIGFYGQTWEECEPEPEIDVPAERPSRHWLMLGDGKTLECELLAHMTSLGHRTTLVEKGRAFEKTAHGYRLDPRSREDFKSLIDALIETDERPTDIVSLWSLKAAGQKSLPSADSLLAWQNDSVMSLVGLVQAASADDSWEPRLWVITSGAQYIPGIDRGRASAAGAWSLSQVPAQGLMRSILAEMPGLKATTVDLDGGLRELGRAALKRELLADGPELEIALRGSKRFVRRLVQFSDDQLMPNTVLRQDLRDNETFRVTMPGPGIIGSLAVVDAERLPPESGELEIAVKAVGLNFRDVMAATGLLPKEAEQGHAWDSLGLECAGVVSRVGPDVTGFKVGDRVMTMGKGSFRGYFRTPAALVFKVPKAVRLEHAATIPSAYVTAYYGLLTLGRLQQGERVLIHTATGGVGFAAVQIAKMAGAEIYATAGSDKKRAYLRKLGIKHIMNSRTLDWADEIMEMTNGEGVDVVLNALAGPAIELGLRVLRPFGRFLEIGKRDIYADSSIGMKQLARNITFHAIDMANVDQRHMPEIMSINNHLLQLFAKREILPPPLKIFPVSRVVDAFETMQKAQHIGKIVVTLDEKDLRIDRDDSLAQVFDAEGAYLVTGGFSGLALRVAEHFSNQGAGHLYLMSRSGATTEEAKMVVRKMRRAGSKVTVLKADVSRRDEVRAALAKVRAGSEPLKGIIHSAVVFDDALLGQLDEQRMQDVLAPKMAGAWNLHHETLDCPLEFFISFSSVASLLGSTGQGNYVAANAFLDNFAAWRRAQGRPAQTINWGVLGETGTAFRNQSIMRYMESMGVLPISVGEALRGLGTIMRKDIDAVGYLKIDWKTLAAVNPAMKSMPRTKDLLTQKASGASGGGQIKATLLGANENERRPLLNDHLTGLVAMILKTDADSIGERRPLNELGLDSLTSFELKNRIESELTVDLPVGIFLQQPTVDGLATAILEHLAAEGPERAVDSAVAEILAPLGKSGTWFWDLQVNHKDAVARNRSDEQALAVTVTPSVDPVQLRQSFNRLTRRHSILRTIFPRRQDGMPRALLSEIHPTGLEVIDTKKMDDPAFQEYLRTLVEVPMDPAAGAAFQVLLFKRPDEDVLLLRAAEPLVDGWSIILILRDLVMGYLGLDTIALADNVAQGKTMTDFIRWETQYLASPEAQKAFKVVAGKIERNRERLSLSEDRPRQPLPAARAGNLTFFFSSKQVETIRRFAGRQGLSVYSVLFAGFVLLVHRLAGRDRFLISGTTANRVRGEFDEVIGCLVNILCHEFDPGKAKSFKELAAATHREVMRNVEIQSMPLAHVLTRMAETDTAYLDVLDGRDNQTSVLQTCFSMRHPGNMDDEELGEFIADSSETASLKFGDVELRRMPIDREAAFFDLAIFIQESGEKIACDCRYNADIYDHRTIKGIVSTYQRLMIAALDHSDVRLDRILDKAAMGKPTKVKQDEHRFVAAAQ